MFHEITRFSPVRITVALVSGRAALELGDDHEFDLWDAFETAQQAGVDCSWNDADALAASVCESAARI